MLAAYPIFETVNIHFLSYIVLLAAAFLFTIKGGTLLTLMIIDLPKEKHSIEDLAVNNPHYYDDQMAATASHVPSSSTSIKNQVAAENKRKYGKIIGVMERLIIVVAVLINEYQIVTLVVAVKSIARFKELNTKTSDYYIIGNLASFSIALLIGMTLVLAKQLLLE